MNFSNFSELNMPPVAVFQKFMYVYCLPIIVCVGLFGNSVSIYLIAIDKQMRNVSSSIYLMSVLAADVGILLSLLLVWLEALGYPLNHQLVVCKTNVYLTYVFGFLSIWYVVCITVETFITICHPTKIKQMCTLFRARAVALMLFLTALALYVTSPIITEIYHENNLCQTSAHFARQGNVIAYMDTVLTLVVPFAILIVLLFLMTVAIIQAVRKKQKRSIKKNTKNECRTHPQVRVAKMLYILSLSVVVMNAPSHVFRLRYLFAGISYLNAVEGLLHLILLFISYCSFSVKFFICITCSKNFRKLFLHHCCCMVWHTAYKSVRQQTMETMA